MDTDRYRKLRSLFHEAVELDAEARAAFVERSCGDDAELRAELDALLSRDGEADDALGGLVRDAVADFPAAEEDPVSHIGSYPLLGKIAEGGMGVVHLGWDPKLMRRVAIKQLPPEIVHDPTALARFHQEAQLLAAINHPNIATIHSLEERDGLHFLTMEYIEGESLKARLARAPMETREALSVCRDIATALQVAHRSGVVHRDLKPANVMITPGGLVKVLDFGLATTVTASGTAAEHYRGAGTPGYMSPEQLRGDETGFATDIWAFGCILHECLTGQAAFPGENAQERNSATLRATVDASRLPAELSDELRELHTICLRPPPDERLQDISLIRDRLGDALGPPPLSRAAGRTHNLPSTLSSFVGREEELKRLEELVRVNRLVSLTGPGGSGKTRLSVETARRLCGQFADGVWQVELAPLSHPELVAQEAASVLRIREQPNKTLEESLAAGIADRSMLLLLDNCEHVLSGAAELAGELLAACENLHIVATSREKLGITGEVVFQVPTLALPPSTSTLPDELSTVESVQLFVDRASAEAHGFTLAKDNAAAVARICRQLDGIPLAIELAAARVGVLSVHEIAERLGDRFRLLTGGNKTAMQQHQTLRSLVDWSYDLLGHKEQQLLRSLSTFAGSWTLSAAESVCALEGIEEEEVLELHSRLVEKSLVEVDSEGCRTCELARYRMLDTIRSYAVERLGEAEEKKRLLLCHRDYFLEFVETSRAHLNSPQRNSWFDLWRTEHENFRQALESFEANGEHAKALRMAASLGQFWDMCGQFREGRTALSKLLEQPENAARNASRGLALEWTGTLNYRLQSYPEAERLLEESLSIQRELGDREGMAQVHDSLAALAKAVGDTQRAQREYEEALRIFRELGDEHLVAVALSSLGNFALQQRDFPTARRYLDEGLSISRRLESPEALSNNLHYLGVLAMSEERFEDAKRYLDEAMKLTRELDEPHGIASLLHDNGRLAERTGELERSLEFQSESLRLRWEMRDKFCSARSILALGVLATRVGDFTRGARLFGASDAILESIQSPLTPLYRAERRESVATLREQLASDALEAEWSRGAGLSMEDLIEYALGG